MTKQKQKSNLMPTIKRMFSYIFKANKFKFALVLFFICISAIVSVASSLFLQELIDSYIVPLINVSNPDFSGLIGAILFMACIYGIGILVTIFYKRIMVKISQKIMLDLRNELFNKMQELPIRYFDTHKHGDIMSHYTNDIDTLNRFFCDSLPSIISAVLTVIVVFFALIGTSIWLSLLVALGVMGMFLVSKNLGGKSAKYFFAQQKSMAELDGFVEEMIQGQKVIQTFCREDRVNTDFAIADSKLKQDSTKANIYGNLLMPINANIGNLTYVSVAIIGGILAVLGVANVSILGVNILTLGAIASFLQLTRTFTQTISETSMQINICAQAVAGANRVFALMDEKSEQDDGYIELVKTQLDENGLRVITNNGVGDWTWQNLKTNKYPKFTLLKGDVRFIDVDFGYVKNKQVLYDINLYAKPGQKIAFVGSTGAGKTTITNLINRFYDIEKGQILYDGIDIKDIRKPSLRRSLGLILQETNLFSGTIADNLRFGNPNATMEEVIEMAKLTNADEFIQKLKDGYNTFINPSSINLSSGQCQLLSITRVAIANPPVLIMDEATSSIDTRTEKIVQNGMDSIMKGRTVFVIAHRLSTIKNSKAIMVLEKGKIIERGSHKDLLNQKGVYYQLYTGAFELE